MKGTITNSWDKGDLFTIEMMFEYTKINGIQINVGFFNVGDIWRG
jgi:hypothetical protein